MYLQGADSIKGLLKKSEEIIPKELWKVTPVSLKATAGLRMLSENSSKKLLEEVNVSTVGISLNSNYVPDLTSFNIKLLLVAP